MIWGAIKFVLVLAAIVAALVALARTWDDDTRK